MFRETVSASCAVTVTIAANRITLSKTSATLKKGSTLALTAAAAPSSAGNKDASWKTSDASAAAVTQSGRIAAKRRIRCKSDTRSDRKISLSD